MAWAGSDSSRRAMDYIREISASCYTDPKSNNDTTGDEYGPASGQQWSEEGVSWVKTELKNKSRKYGWQQSWSF
jgi:hypothetical protein